MDLNADGTNGQISFDGATVTVTRKGLLARATHGSGSKSLPVRSIAGVELKPAGLSAGYIKFSVPGEVTKTGLIGRKAHDAASDENAVLFSRAHQGEFEALAAAIQAAQAAPATSTAALSIADELAKFAALRDQGILTEEEFQARKASLLG